MRAFSENDRHVDADLAALGDSMRFLLDVTPMNAAQVRARWVAGDHCEPDFAYRELSTDPDVLKAGLPRIDVNTVDDPTLRSLLAAKHRELTQQAEMMRARNTSDFLPLAIEHYGAVTPALRDSTTIALSTLHSDAVVCGAAAVAIIYFLDRPSMFFDVSAASSSPDVPKRQHNQ